ncbi:MAG: hypothetical protein D6E12_04230 [Desulfovibrio sp.]|nr:MAG: hypothetical protein D6E12_04230 [Desulfovibrio sp.]
MRLGKESNMKRFSILAVCLLLLAVSACSQRALAPSVANDQYISVSSHQDFSPADPEGSDHDLDQEVEALLGDFTLQTAFSAQGLDQETPVHVSLEVPLNEDMSAWERRTQEQYRHLGRLLEDNPGLSATIEGFSLGQGRQSSNVAVSQVRAEAVRNDLASRFSIDQRRLLAIGRGDEAPSRQGSGQEGWISITVQGVLSPSTFASAPPVPDPAETSPYTASAPLSASTAGTGYSATLHFSSGQADLTGALAQELAAMAELLAGSPHAALNIEGHTDNVGSREANRLLSKERAEMVKSLLVAQYGIDPQRLFTVGYGEEQPLADNGSEVGRAMNRRVEVSLVDHGVIVPSQAVNADYEIEISISQCRLWLYENTANGARTLIREFAVATAKEGTEYPSGQGYVTAIDTNPWWHPTPSMIQRARNQGRSLEPTPPGASNNPMGAFKIHLSHGGDQGAFRIHGTNRPSQIGRRVSLGCIRMHNDEGLQLARLIEVGTPVTIFY